MDLGAALRSLSYYESNSSIVSVYTAGDFPLPRPSRLAPKESVNRSMPAGGQGFPRAAGNEQGPEHAARPPSHTSHGSWPLSQA
jgi:hypothetical protein